MRFRRSSICLLVASLAAAPFLLPHPAAGNAALSPTAGDRTELKDILENGLKARRDDQLLFIARVVTLVDQGRLKESLVLAAYRYAVRKRSSYPFPYFQLAMIQLAKKEGINL